MIRKLSISLLLSSLKLTKNIPQQIDLSINQFQRPF